MTECKIRWSSPALTALDDVAESALTDRILNRVDMLASYPLSGVATRSRTLGAVRRAVVRPFILLYLPIEATHTIHVLALEHGRRDWRARSLVGARGDAGDL